MTIKTIRSNTQKQKPVPGPSTRHPLGFMGKVQADPLGTLRQIAEDYEGFARFRAGFWDVYLVAHPDPVREILRDQQRNFSKNTFTYNMVQSVGGPGLLTLSGEAWQPRRRLMQPIFAKERMARLDQTITEPTRRLLEQWQRLAETGEAFDVGAAVNQLTLEIVAKAFFDVDIAEGQALRTATDQLSHAFAHRFRSPMAAIWGLVGFPAFTNPQLYAAQQTIEQTVQQIIEQMRQAQAPSENLVAQLARATDDETGARLTEQELRTEIMTLLLAGHETTARLLGWALYLLSHHHHVLAKLTKEVKSHLQGRLPTAEDLAMMPYLRMVVDETLRLYPSVWAFSRRAEENVTICGCQIPKGARLLISPYVLHRQASFWPEPDRFDPERFAATPSESATSHAYIPFGAGPRQCIGKRFALLETQLIVAMVVSRFTLHAPTAHPIEADAVTTLTPKSQIMISLRPH